MWIRSTLLEEVGIRLLLLPIYLLSDFTLLDDSIQFNPKVGFSLEHIRYLLWILQYITGHYFYIKKNFEDSNLHLLCSDQPDFFKKLLPDEEKT